MCFPRIDAPSRTDASFRGIEDPGHHQIDEKTKQIVISPFVEISPEDLDMIKDFPVADSLHLIESGNFFFENVDFKYF